MSDTEMVLVPRSAATVGLRLVAEALQTLANGAAIKRCKDAGLAFRTALNAEPAKMVNGVPLAPIAASPLEIPEECPHLIVFDDADRQQLMFAGTGAREAALKTWEQISNSWNAHLFVRVERNSRDDRYPSAAAVSASEPVGLAAVAVLRDDGDGGLEPEWLLEGGTAELVEGTLLLVADDQSLCAEDGHAELYRCAPGAEA